MKVRILAVYYTRPENKGKYHLKQIDFGVKRTTNEI